MSKTEGSRFHCALARGENFDGIALPSGAVENCLPIRRESSGPQFSAAESDLVIQRRTKWGSRKKTTVRQHARGQSQQKSSGQQNGRPCFPARSCLLRLRCSYSLFS